MADSPQDRSPHAGQVVRRVLLRRNIAVDPETAQLVAAAVQAALQAGASSRPPRRGPRVPPPAASRCSDMAPAIRPAWCEQATGSTSRSARSAWHDCAGEVESGRESVYLQVTGPSGRFREEAAAVMAPYPQAASWLVVRRP